MDPPRTDEGKPRSRRLPPSARTALLLVALAGACFSAYFNTLSNGFVYDDEDQVVSNPWIRDVRSLPKIFTSNAWAYTGEVANYYRPVMHVVYMACFHLFGLDPAGFHLVNVLLHSLNTILVYSVLLLLLDRHGPGNVRGHAGSAFLGALLFATHPIHTEAVAWVGGVPELTFTLFGLLSLYGFLLSRGEGPLSPRACSILSALMFFAAALCKETALVLPVLFLGYDLAFSPERRKPADVAREYSPYLLSGLLYFVLRLHALHGMAPVTRHAELGVYGYLINVFPLLAKYIGKLLLPLNLNVFHAFHPLRGMLDPAGILSLSCVLGLGIVLTLAYGKRKMVFFGILVVLLPLLPALYIPGLGENPFAERYLYFPSIGFVLLLAHGVASLRGARPDAAVPLSVACCLLAGIYSFGTVDRNRDWKDEYTLWEDTVRKSPDAPVPNYNFGLLLYQRGDADGAIRYFRNALRFAPSARVYTDLGLAYASKGDVDGAIRLHQEAIRLDPGYALAHNNLGVALENKGFLQESIEPFRTAIRLSPGFASAYNNLGYSYFRLGRRQEALECYYTALRLDPGNPRILANLKRLDP